MKRGGCARQGSAPAVLYGAGGDAVAVAVNPKEVNRILHSKTGHNTIFNLAVTGGETTPVMIVDWQNDPDQGHSAARRPEAHRSDASAFASRFRCTPSASPRA